VAGTACEFGGAAIAYLMTGSVPAAAITATIGASMGYYAAAYAGAMRWLQREHSHRPWAQRITITNLLALRSVAIEFGPAELIDSILVRPLAFYIGPVLFDNMIIGWLFGKLVSDLAFYACAVFSYERFKGLLAGRRPQVEEVDGESVPSVAAA
jgi:hypothetical protein